MTIFGETLKFLCPEIQKIIDASEAGDKGFPNKTISLFSMGYLGRDLMVSAAKRARIQSLLTDIDKLLLSPTAEKVEEVVIAPSQEGGRSSKPKGSKNKESAPPVKCEVLADEALLAKFKSMLEGISSEVEQLSTRKSLGKGSSADALVSLAHLAQHFFDTVKELHAENTPRDLEPFNVLLYYLVEYRVQKLLNAYSENIFTYIAKFPTFSAARDLTLQKIETINKSLENCKVELDGKDSEADKLRAIQSVIRDLKREDVALVAKKLSVPARAFNFFAESLVPQWVRKRTLRDCLLDAATELREKKLIIQPLLPSASKALADSSFPPIASAAEQ